MLAALVSLITTVCQLTIVAIFAFLIRDLGKRVTKLENKDEGKRTH